MKKEIRLLIDNDTFEKLKVKSFKLGIPITYIVRYSIKKYLEKGKDDD